MRNSISTVLGKKKHNTNTNFVNNQPVPFVRHNNNNNNIISLFLEVVDFLPVRRARDRVVCPGIVRIVSPQTVRGRAQ